MDSFKQTKRSQFSYFEEVRGLGTKRFFKKKLQNQRYILLYLIVFYLIYKPHVKPLHLVRDRKPTSIQSLNKDHRKRMHLNPLVKGKDSRLEE